jgi:hypothetical protein
MGHSEQENIFLIIYIIVPLRKFWSNPVHGFPSGQRGGSQDPVRKLRGFESHIMHHSHCEFSKGSRVVKGVGLKHQCICFVGSNPTSCI